MTNALLLELVRQLLRWTGVWLMTLGVPENIAGLTAHEDVIMGVVGFLMYLTADTGWLVAKYRELKRSTWWRFW